MNFLPWDEGQQFAPEDGQTGDRLFVKSGDDVIYLQAGLFGEVIYG